MAISHCNICNNHYAKNTTHKCIINATSTYNINKNVASTSHIDVASTSNLNSDELFSSEVDSTLFALQAPKLIPNTTSTLENHTSVLATPELHAGVTSPFRKNIFEKFNYTLSKNRKILQNQGQKVNN